jgi:hypothetical protein
MKAPNKRPAAHNRTPPHARDPFAAEKQARLAKRRTAFLAADEEGDLAALVKIARRAMRDRIWAWSAIAEDIVPLEAVQELAGEFPEDHRGGPVAWDLYGRHVDAAFALGIALGQFVHPDVFTMGGAK